MPMTKQSREICRLVVEVGLTTREVAEMFGITHQRVKAIIQKLEPRGVQEARRKFRDNHRPDGS